MRKGIVSTLGIIVLFGIAWWGGVAIGNLLSKPDQADQESGRKEITASFLNQTDAIATGGRWPDIPLQSLDGSWIRLSDVINDTLLLIVIQPGCEACEQELDSLNELLSSDQASLHILLISDAYPLDLVKLRDERAIKSLILVDRNRDIFRLFDLMVFPLNVTIAPSMTIVGITVGILTEDEVRKNFK